MSISRLFALFAFGMVALLMAGCAMAPKHVAKVPPTISDFVGKPPVWAVMLDLNGDGLEDYVFSEPMANMPGKSFLNLHWGLSSFKGSQIGGAVTGQSLRFYGVSAFRFVRPPYGPGYWLILQSSQGSEEVTLDLTAADPWTDTYLYEERWVSGFPVKQAIPTVPGCRWKQPCDSAGAPSPAQ